jgi:hypothetical protein
MVRVNSNHSWRFGHRLGTGWDRHGIILENKLRDYPDTVIKVLYIIVVPIRRIL